MATDFDDNDLENRVTEVKNKLNGVEESLTEINGRVDAIMNDVGDAKKSLAQYRTATDERKLKGLEDKLTEAFDKCSGQGSYNRGEKLEKFKQLIQCRIENKINKAIELYMELIECKLENKIDKAIAKCRKGYCDNDDDKLKELLDELKRRISKLEGKCRVPRQFLRGFSGGSLDQDRQSGRYSRKVRKKYLSWSDSI